MAIPRRQFLRLAVSAAAFPVCPRIANAQIYPARPVRMIVGFPAGGGADVPLRVLGQWLSDRLGQPFIVENRPGAGTNIAAEAVVRAAPDGHALLLITPANAINVTLYDRLNFNFIRDIAPVAGLFRAPLILTVNPSLPARSIPEFIAYAKANPGKINMASGGNGVPSHVSGELFKIMAGINMVHVPYRGAPPALTDLIGGQVQVMFADMASSIDHIRTGRLRALAVTTTARSELLPDVPTVSETVPAYEASTWFGLGAPSNTPADVVDKLNKEINAGLADAKIKSRLIDLGGTVLVGSPADFQEIIRDETEKWAKVIKNAGIKLG